MADNSGEPLVVLMGKAVAGTLTRHANNMLHFRYDDDYHADPSSTPISLSMPLAVREHGDTTRSRTVTNFLWGLLPDNEAVVGKWARHYGVRESSPFHLLGTPVGEDCAGAVSFCRQSDLPRLLSRNAPVEWLSTSAIADLLRDLRTDRRDWLGRAFGGQFSLAGAQAKTALFFDGQRWGRPSGWQATTHILKPESEGFDDQDIVEHLCLAAASRAGLVVAKSSLMEFGDQKALVLTRYDRVVSGGDVIRIHQEDMCQAMGRHPDAKYEADGGPSAHAITELMRQAMPPRDADDGAARFADALIWNWIIAGTDAHAKNYSLLLAGPDVRLAPLYDIGSILPYVDVATPGRETISARDVASAMKIGGSYDLYPPRNRWPKAASEMGLRADALVDRARHLAAIAPDAFADAAADSPIAEIKSAVVDRLVDRVAVRAAACAEVLGQMP